MTEKQQQQNQYIPDATLCTNELRAVVREHTQNWCYPKSDKMPAQKWAEHISKDK